MISAIAFSFFKSYTIGDGQWRVTAGIAKVSHVILYIGGHDIRHSVFLFNIIHYRLDGQWRVTAGKAKVYRVILYIGGHHICYNFYHF